MIELIARKNLKLVVSKRQFDILVGCLMGDGYIHPRGQIQIAHSTKQVKYLNWKYKELRSLSYGSPTIVSRFDTRYKKSYSVARFWLRQFFSSWRKDFYQNGKKIIPINYLNKVSELSLAVWYMDDGNFSENRSVRISTDGFDLPEVLKIQDFLMSKFGIQSTLQKSGKLRISSNSLDKFFSLITPFVHSSMKYKIP